MIRRIVILFLVFAVISSAQKSSKKTVEPGNVEHITQEQLHDYLSFIASDELEGRDTPSKGLNIAAKFLATHLSRWGYTPAGDSGSYFQKILLHKTRVVPEKSTVEFNGITFVFGGDFIARSVAGSFTAPMVFVKNGYIVKSKNINPYEGIDVKGKIIVILDGYPKGVTRGDFGLKLGEDYDTPTNYAKTHDAAGIIVVPSAKGLSQWEKDKTSAVDKGDLSVPAFKTSDAKQPVPVVIASLRMVDAIFSGEKTGVQTMSVRASADSAESFVLSAGKSVSVNIGVRIDTLYTQNVVAVLEGSDKKLKNEYVAFGAHYDHIGLRSEPLNGDSIYNGADDDGSGTVGLLAMAETFASGPRPKRSLLFVWHAGEEKGLWGSKYFVQHPTVPISDIVTQLNIDMIGRSKPDTGEAAVNTDISGKDELFSIGSKMMSSELGALNEQNNASLYNMKLNYKFDDPTDPNRLFYRSDHYNYAKNGVPIVFYFDGIHEDYHRVSDEVEKIDFEKLTEVTRTIYSLGWKLATIPKRPAIDKTFNAEDID
ncbi:MAG: M28 family peptidase [Bacteriovoracaceae bacterium]|nr:M28 family peptidase [Bacteroidota bacterium]